MQSQNHKPGCLFSVCLRLERILCLTAYVLLVCYCVSHYLGPKFTELCPNTFFLGPEHGLARGFMMDRILRCGYGTLSKTSTSI